jgi:hypothetical protein
VPLRTTVCGEFDALFEIERMADRFPGAPGVKAIVTLQLAPIARLAPQVVVFVKSEMLVPPMEIARLDSVAEPELVMVTLWGVLSTPIAAALNCSAEAERLTAGAMAVPVRATVCGDPELLSTSESVATAAPAAVGAKVTITVQVAPLLSTAPQVLVSLNSTAFVPLMEMAEMLAGARPVLFTITV